MPQANTPDRGENIKQFIARNGISEISLQDEFHKSRYVSKDSILMFKMNFNDTIRINFSFEEIHLEGIFFKDTIDACQYFE